MCEQGFTRKRNAFVQAYESENLDASLLTIPLVGFLPADDPRVRGNCCGHRAGVDARRVRRPVRHEGDGGRPAAGEGTFLPCTFWYADNLALQGRREEATAIFGRLLDLRNDVGLLSEEYDPPARRLVGNFPQAFTHIGLINTAINLTSPAHCPAGQRPSK